MRDFVDFKSRPGAWMLGDSAIHLMFITVNDMEKWMFDWCLPQVSGTTMTTMATVSQPDE